ncbi:MAG: hypothetical protein NC411_07055 [Bacteroides sp.]|nr:hypothetical protein [Bacteroides sp.]
MKKKLMIMFAVVAGLVQTGCGGGDAKKAEAVPAAEEVEVRKSQLEQALTSGNLKQASVMADSMSLFVDDFTPEQTVQVLTAFVSLHNDATRKHESRRDLETLRKYVDVYDIALSVNPKDTREAFRKAMRKNPELDFDSIARAFREKLSQYDSMQDGSAVGPAETPADTAAIDSVTPEKPKELPVELRPAV